MEPEAVTQVTPSMFDMVLGSGPLVLGVLVLLLTLSVWSWAIAIAKSIQFRRINNASDEFSELFWETRNFARVDDSSRRLESSPLAHIFTTGYRELTHMLQDKDGTKRSGDMATDLGIIERSLKRAELEESQRLESGITFLASVASSAPFIGLFGTVWGIMNAFHGLGEAKSSTIQAVAPGISEALLATAVGLAAAIPAAVAYNYFSANLKRFRQRMAGFSEEFLNMSRRYFVR